MIESSATSDSFDRDLNWLHWVAWQLLNRPWPADMAREHLATMLETN